MLSKKQDRFSCKRRLSALKPARSWTSPVFFGRCPDPKADKSWDEAGRDNKPSLPLHHCIRPKKNAPKGVFSRPKLTWRTRRGVQIRCTADADDQSCIRDRRSSRSTEQSSQPYGP